MFSSFEIWKLLAGVVFFLLGMRFLEEGIQQLAGRPFKLFLKKQVASKPKAVLGGAVVTTILQSSSVVNLMVLAFVGANIIQMQNALAVMLGANLGTTATSWWVATIGFKFDLEIIALPAVSIAGLVMLLINKESRLYHWSKFLFGLGSLFFGLHYMKTGMEDTVSGLALSSFEQYPALIFVLIGLLITSLIQSSSATVAIILSALNVSAISLFAATAMVIGAEIGTTLKLILASVKGLPSKKRVALGNFLFNIITAIIMLIFLWPVNRFITEAVGISDNLLALVFFQSLLNLLGILLFYPFLNMFGRFLEKRFTKSSDEALSIHKVKVKDTELALLTLEKEVKYFILSTIDFVRDVFDMPEESIISVERKKFHPKNQHERYEYLKYLHGDIYSYCIQLQNSTTAKDITLRMHQLIAANRNTMYAAKSVKDAFSDIKQLRNSSNNIKYEFYQQASKKVDTLLIGIATLLLKPKPDEDFDNLVDIYKSVTGSYTQVLKQLYSGEMHKNLNETEISTLINFNREMYTSYKSFVFALRDFLLDEEQSDYFEELPGFIR